MTLSGAVDYANPDNWLATPDTSQFPVDVFYLYPTAWAGQPGGPPVCPVDHPKMRRGAETVFYVQASVFMPFANVHAPYYRQLNLGLGLAGDERDAVMYGSPYADVVAAFGHYLRHGNQGRPFFLFGHSHGAHAGKRLVAELIGRDPALRARMVAAYLIGYGVTRAELAARPEIPFARGADDTGVIVGYNTEPPGFGENQTVPAGSVAINPLSWTRDETPAPASMNPGSLISGGGRLFTGECFADATVDLARGTVICSTVDPAIYGGPPPLSPFHGLDVGLYYQSLRENAQTRLAAWRR